MQKEAAAAAWVFFGALAFLLAGCSSVPSSGITRVKAGRVELSDEFKNGEARLGCRMPCALTWGLFRDRAKALYNARAWSDLAVNVLRIGYADDLTYFYLGKAAEGLGHYRAAENYYRLSRAAPLKCVDIYGDCYGFVFPRDARIAGRAVVNKTAEIKNQYTAAPLAASPESRVSPADSASNPHADRGPGESAAKDAEEPHYRPQAVGRGDPSRSAAVKPSEPEKRPAGMSVPKTPAARKSVQQTDSTDIRAENKPAPALAPVALPNVTFEEVSRKFGSHSGLSEAQKREEWKKYQGRCVEWAGELSYIGESFFRGLTLGFKHDPRTLTYDVLVSAPDEARGAALRMKKGEHYSYRGTLKKYGGAVLPISLSWGCSTEQRGNERAKAE